MRSIITLPSIITVVVTAALACTGAIHGQDTKSSEAPKVLKPGDKAPGIKIGTWIKGDAFTAFEPGKVTVMEFWATWCGPCIMGIPHLTDLQKKYKDQGVTILGTAIWQREPDQQARVNTVRTFVERQGDKMGYTVAVDDGSWMSDHWMRAAGRNGIPSAFIVGKTGNVEWMGHPGSMDAPLKAIIAGTFDREAFAKQEALDRKWRKDRRQIQTEMAIAREKGDNAEVFRIVNEASAEYPDVPWLQRERYRLMMQFSKDASEVRVYGKTIAKKNWDDPQFLNAISWWTVDDKLARHRDLDGALAWAKRADELTEHKDPQIIDTLARCWWERGDTVQAIETQRKAVSLAEGDLKAQLEATLSEYIRDSKAA